MPGYNTNTLTKGSAGARTPARQGLEEFEILESSDFLRVPGVVQDGFELMLPSGLYHIKAQILSPYNLVADTNANLIFTSNNLFTNQLIFLGSGTLLSGDTLESMIIENLVMVGAVANQQFLDLTFNTSNNVLTMDRFVMVNNLTGPVTGLVAGTIKSGTISSAALQMVALDQGLTLEDTQGIITKFFTNNNIGSDFTSLSIIGENTTRLVIADGGFDAATGQSGLYVDPRVVGPIVITSLGQNGDGDYFQQAGESGDITAFADASIASTGISSVTDDGLNNPQFNHAGTDPAVGQETVVIGYGGAYTSYNGTHIVTSVPAAGQFVISALEYISPDAGAGGSFTSEAVVVTATNTLSDDELINILGSEFYESGHTVFDTSGTDFTINATFVAETNTNPTYSSNSLDQSDPRVDVARSGSQATSMSIADLFYTNSAGGAVVLSTDVPAAIGSAGGVDWEVSPETEGFTITDDGVAIYKGVDPKSHQVSATAKINTPASHENTIGILLETALAATPTTWVEEPGSRTTYTARNKDSQLSVTLVTIKQMNFNDRCRLSVVNETNDDPMEVYSGKLTAIG